MPDRLERPRKQPSHRWRLVRGGLLHRLLQDRLDLVGLDLAGLDLLGPVTGDEMPRWKRAELRHVIAAAGRLHVRAAGVEAAGGRRVCGARHVAGEKKRRATKLHLGVWDGHGREERDGVGVERVLVELVRRWPAP